MPGSRRVLRLLLFSPLALIAQSGAVQAPPGSPPAGIAIRPVEGDGAINSIKLHRAHDPVVQIVNAGGEPVPGAAVTFILPATGASGSFGNEGLSLTVVTDSKGMAAARGMQPNRIEGPFRVRVAASWHGAAASTTLTQTNAGAAAKSGSSKTIVILALIGAAAAGGAVAATHGSKSGSADTATPASTAVGATITAGTPTFGPPH